MKKQRTLDGLKESLQGQKEAIVLDSEAKSEQYFCGIGGYAKDFAHAGKPPKKDG